MPLYLKQSTASQEIPLGIFVSSTDGDTEASGLTIANTDIKLWKSGATTLASKNSGGATYISNGIYYCVLDATDTDTLGSLVIFIHVATALAVKVECVVLAANVYDSLIGGTDLLDTSTVQWTGTNVSAATAGIPDVNAKNINNAAAPTLTGDAYARIGANGAGLTAVGDTRLANLDAAVSTRSTYAGGDTSGTTTLLSRLTALRAGLLDNLDATISSRLASASYTAPDNTDIGAIKTQTDKLAFTGSLVNAQAKGLDADVITSSALAASAVNEIVAGLLAGVVEGTITVQQALMLVDAVLAGKASGGATTTMRYRNPADTKNRVTATVDADGNRSAVTLDFT